MLAACLILIGLLTLLQEASTFLISEKQIRAGRRAGKITNPTILYPVMRNRMTTRKEVTNNMEEVAGLIKDWEPRDLKSLRTKIHLLLLEKPMDIKFEENLEYLKDRLVLYDKGEADDGDIDDILADTVHNYILQWKDGDEEELNIQIVNQEGYMYAGSMKFECQGLKIGPLVVVKSFPETKGGYRTLPEFVSGLEELCPMLAKHGIDSKEKVVAFVKWIMNDVCDGRSCYLQSKELFAKYSYERCMGLV